jgi:hypothetical protein
MQQYFAEWSAARTGKLNFVKTDIAHRFWFHPASLTSNR